MQFRFSKENMWTAAGFVLDSFVADAPAFEDVSASEFGPNFQEQLVKAREQVKGAVGGALRAGAGTQVTARLYQNMDTLKPLLDRLDIRLGLAPAKSLANPVKDFGLKTLRTRLDARDAEASSRALTVLEAAIAASRDALAAVGYPATEEAKLLLLHQAIDDDNALQNKTLNTSTGTTLVEDKDYTALNKLLDKVMRTGRLLFKNNKQKRRQYETIWIQKRVAAGEKPQADA
ncbi:MAG: hypothetical protein JWP58_3487 [Hymenobacter sp.]|nr:hypothetical protein [Hymenobacter sp.]